MDEQFINLAPPASHADDTATTSLATTSLNDAGPTLACPRGRITYVRPGGVRLTLTATTGASLRIPLAPHRSMLRAADGAGRSIDAYPYQSLLLAPGERISERSAQDSDADLLFVELSGPFWAILCGRHGIDAGSLDPHGEIFHPELPELADRLRRLLLSMEDGADGRGDLADQLLGTLGRLIGEALAYGGHRESRGVRGLTERQATRLLDHIRDNLDQRLTLPDMAAVVNLSTCHFARVFTKTFGVPPHHFVRAERIRRAQRLLHDRSRSLADIAYATGFSSQSHMTGAFREQLGITPGRLRRTIRRRVRAAQPAAAPIAFSPAPPPAWPDNAAYRAAAEREDHLNKERQQALGALAAALDCAPKEVLDRQLAILSKLDRGLYFDLMDRLRRD